MDVRIEACVKTRLWGRRQFLLTSFAAFGTTLLLKTYNQDSTSAVELSSSRGEDPSEYLGFSSVPPRNSQPPTGLIVCLHGSSGQGHDLVSMASALKLPKYQFLFPDAPFADEEQPGDKKWYDLNSQEHLGLGESRQLLTNWLKSLESTTGVPLSRTILSGFSQGAAMALDVGLTLPLAGLVSLSGYVHSKPRFSGVRSFPPVLMVQGRKDTIVTRKEAIAARNSLKALGVPVKYQEFNIGHELKPEVLALMRKFVVDVLG